MMDLEILQQFLNEILRIGKGYFIFASITFILFYFILKKRMWFRKIQQKMPTIKDYRRDIVYSAISIFIIAIAIVITFRGFSDYTKVYKDFNDYSVGYFIFTLFWLLFLHDTWFYWTHRAMHHPLIFKRVHLIHHKSTNPSPWTAYAFHPFETIIGIGIVPLVAFSLPISIHALILYSIFEISFNVYGHLGFEILPKQFHKTKFGRWINTSTAHNLHHHKFLGNYGLYSLFWDRLMGTVREDYDKTYELVTSRKNLNEKVKEIFPLRD